MTLSFRLSLVASVACIALVYPTLSYADFAPPPPPPPIPTVNVTDTCTPATTGGVSHTYTAQYLGICALLAAKDQGAVSNYSLSSYDPVFGFFLESINGVIPGATEFWAVDKDGDDSLGLSSMMVASDNIITFQLTDWMTSTTIGDPVRFKIGTLTATPAESASGGSGGVWMHPPFDVPLAFQYLAHIQNIDGSFGSPMLNDWVAIALSAGDSGNVRAKLRSYELAHPILSTTVTENERHAMALQALGINPYTGTSVDYITPIVQSFDGTQFGDASLVNDDIFAIFPLLHAGYTVHDPMIASTTAFIIRKQSADGSWASSVDMTAAAIQVLALMPDTGDTRFAISKATGFLRGKQMKDGSFGDPSASSWMLQAIAAMHGTASDWQQNHYTADYYLATRQDTDGGIVASSTSDRIWATAYAIPGVRRATWDSLLASFSKPAPTPVTTTPTTTIVTTPSGPVFRVAVAAAASLPHTDIDPTEVARNTSATSSQSASAASAAGGTNENYLFLLIAFLILLAYCALAYWSIRRRRR